MNRDAGDIAVAANRILELVSQALFSFLDQVFSHATGVIKNMRHYMESRGEIKSLENAGKIHKKSE